MVVWWNLANPCMRRICDANKHRMDGWVKRAAERAGMMRRGLRTWLRRSMVRPLPLWVVKKTM